MNSIARSLFWWPNLDLDIDDRVRTYNECIQNSHMLPKHLPPWPTAARVWSRIHIDYAGLVEGLMILVAQDAHSKWIVAMAVRNATTAVTIEKWRTPLALHGISPAEIMLGRQIRCRLDLVHSPSPNSNALEAPHNFFQNGEEVYIRNYASGERWVPGVINNPIGNIRLRSDP
ncbi:hypothetical protein JTE90_006537 [Oedothorax gibbosus]|uniref:Integrase zinc-binding domain-containing protein n=1 Tax=Oedothorax gibbosus TaxID=931172 RepID=A0AAV6TNY8_9ARAC|nr:hypothetical protein JTE90_006537 [Oedothorax gibbosus]